MQAIYIVENWHLISNCIKKCLHELFNYRRTYIYANSNLPSLFGLTLTMWPSCVLSSWIYSLSSRLSDRLLLRSLRLSSDELCRFLDLLVDLSPSLLDSLSEYLSFLSCDWLDEWALLSLSEYFVCLYWSPISVLEDLASCRLGLFSVSARWWWCCWFLILSGDLLLTLQ